MATSLLRLGRLGSFKCLLRESWGAQTTPFVAALCTKADAPPKTIKKAKSASKTIEAEERASLLAYKPAVAFPSKLSATGFLLKDIALGESESSAKVVTTETVVAAAATTEEPPSASQFEVTTSEELTKDKENAAPASEATEAISVANAKETTTGSSVADIASSTATSSAAVISEVQTSDDVTTASEQSKASDVEAEEQQDQKDTSSSSSSDSDSDSDDENPEIKSKTEMVKSQGQEGEEKEAPVVTNKVNGAKNEVEYKSIIEPSALFEESQESAKAVIKAKPEEVVLPSTEAVDPRETLIDPAPVLSTSMTEAIPEVNSESISVVALDEMVDTATEGKTTPSEDIVENEAETKAKTATEETQQTSNVKTTATVVPECSPEVIANTIVEASPGVATEAPRVVFSEAVQEVVAKPKFEAASETVTKAVGAKGIKTAPSEDLEDPPPVAADSVESLTETEVVETSEEQAPEKAPEPEPEPEPFDNTTYKNLQHHHYNMYTFADMDVEMSKHRLPQPSSGRPSPRH